MARATRSSLNAQRSSMEPPPRPTITTSSSSRVARVARAATISPGASSPCTRTGTIRMRRSPKRRPMIFSMSRMAAPVGEVTIPITRGKAGSGRLRASAKRPSASSRRLSCSKAYWSAPTPLGSRSSTTNWYSPRGG
jgi:hypothetical protein